jgi:hypothetical protein
VQCWPTQYATGVRNVTSKCDGNSQHKLTLTCLSTAIARTDPSHIMRKPVCEHALVPSWVTLWTRVDPRVSMPPPSVCCRILRDTNPSLKITLWQRTGTVANATPGSRPIDDRLYASGCSCQVLVWLAASARGACLASFALVLHAAKRGSCII